MKLFKDYTFHWWQFGLLKIALIALGILIGSYWAEYFKSSTVITALWLAFILPAIYLMGVALKQSSAADK